MTIEYCRRMPRYELDGLFWEAQIDDNSLVTKAGTTGTPGTITHQEFASAAAARKACHKRIATKLREGYRRVDAYYEYRSSTSSKFWEITLSGKMLKTRYGRIGTRGKETFTTYKGEQEARAQYAKLVRQKTQKGYVLVDGDEPHW
jgi:predicted DNA-binding WGR domain protein